MSNSRSVEDEGQDTEQMPKKERISKRTAKLIELFAMVVAFAVIVGLLSIPAILPYTQVCESVRNILRADFHRLFC